MKPISSFVSRHREVLTYLMVGGCTTALSWGIFALAIHLNAGTLAANNIANAIAILFAFFANKTLVFRSPLWALRHLLPEAGKFFASRLLTHILETFALLFLIDILHLNPILMKALTMALIQICGNYVLSKWVVFVRK